MEDDKNTRPPSVPLLFIPQESHSQAGLAKGHEQEQRNQAIIPAGLRAHG